MKLNLVCQQYAVFQKALGERFVTNGRYVKAFCLAMGSDIDIAAVSPEKVNTFLNGNGPLTTTWQVRHNALLGFYRYAISRGFISNSPLPWPDAFVKEMLKTSKADSSVAVPNAASGMGTSRHPSAATGPQ